MAEFNIGTAFQPHAVGAVDNKEKETEDTVTKSFVNEEEDKEYFEKRSVTIALVKNYSCYRRANDKALAARKDYIGSSINSSRVLTSNKDEIEAYLPNIIGIAPNNENFVTRVKQYFNNIQIKVDNIGVTFDTSFHWKTKRDYAIFKGKEEQINKEYDTVPRNNLEQLEEALKNKISKLNTLESQKYKYGRPNNVEDYLMYRHCLLYNDIAKDIAFINSNQSIRFYFKDNIKENEKLKAHRREVVNAKTNYAACIADSSLFEAVYIAYCASNNLPINASLAENQLDKEIKLDKFSTEYPDKFNKIFTDKDLKTKAIIEKLISKGELVRLPYNQNITTPSGDIIGANVKEAVAWFKNVDNATMVNVYMNKLNNI